MYHNITYNSTVVTVIFKAWTQHSDVRTTAMKRTSKTDATHVHQCVNTIYTYMLSILSDLT